MDVPDVGRFAALTDSNGAFFSVIALKQHATERPSGAPGQFLWVELMSRDFPKSRAFYTDLLDWQAEEVPMPGGNYTLFRTANGAAGGGMVMPQEVPDMVPDNWVGYVHVPAIDKSCQDVERMGGTVLFAPMDIPGAGRFCQIQDPTGAVVALLQPTPMS